MRRPRVLIADHAATRAGIRIALDAEVEICAEADDAGRVIEAAHREQPDVCLVGNEIPGDWLAAVRGICRVAPRSAVVVLAHVSDVGDLLETVRAGAVGYIPGPLDGERLRRLIAAVVASEAVIPRSMVLDLLTELRSHADDTDGLTHRESEVLGMLRRGHTTAAIADRLHIAPVTVRRHISGLVHKLGVADRTALLRPTAASPSYGRSS